LPSTASCHRKYNIPTGVISGLINGKRNCYKGYVIVRSGVPFSYKVSSKARDMKKSYKIEVYPNDNVEIY
jgi:hypothetical protein